MNTIPLPEIIWLWGPGVFILVLGYLMIQSLARYIGKQFLAEFLASQRRQADAIESLCRAITAQRTDDEFSHREIILNVKVLQKDLQKLNDRLEGIDDKS